MLDAHLFLKLVIGTEFADTNLLTSLFKRLLDNLFALVPILGATIVDEVSEKGSVRKRERERGRETERE